MCMLLFALSGKMLMNSCNCRLRYSYVSSTYVLLTVKACHTTLAPDCWHPQKTKVPLLSLRPNPKLLLAMKPTTSVASSDTQLNKYIKWFGCTSRYVSHTAIYCSSPCYSMQTQTERYLSCHQLACDTAAVRIVVCSHTDHFTLPIYSHWKLYLYPR